MYSRVVRRGGGVVYYGQDSEDNMLVSDPGRRVIELWASDGAPFAYILKDDVKEFHGLLTAYLADQEK